MGCGGDVHDPFDIFQLFFGGNPFSGGGSSRGCRQRRGEDVIHPFKGAWDVNCHFAWGSLNLDVKCMCEERGIAWDMQGSFTWELLICMGSEWGTCGLISGEPWPLQLELVEAHYELAHGRHVERQSGQVHFHAKIMHGRGHKMLEVVAMCYTKVEPPLGHGIKLFG
ncbi:hypothetical protein GH714_001971 [Hevea brasiliensis]|uniref:Uncharacterized protein n=1 Tax=Hevea brasiliensis TaxID=3981 RepID=A0A6A6N0S9_HEVBR|nr:hypothetical protein GH714_001971 [Hevea brasiliensis]